MINSLRSAAKKAGLPWKNITGCRKNEIADRPRLIDILLNTGRMKIERGCTRLRKAIGRLKWDEKSRTFRRTRTLETAMTGGTVNSNALGIIGTCDSWYANRVIDDFHKRNNLNNVEYELIRMNFAKRCCADDANLCEIISVAPEQGEEAQHFIDDLLNENRFDARYREQLEKTSATGTVGAYIYLQNMNYTESDGGTMMAVGGKMRINYVDADSIIPLTVENGLATECAFAATNKVKGKDRTTLVIFTLENGRYAADTVVFDEWGKQIGAESFRIQLGDVKPFAIMTNAEVNNLDDMYGYGLPKIYNSIPLFMAVDLCYNILQGDLSKGQKMVFINELLSCIRTDKDGKPYLTPQQKEIFILLGEDGDGKMPEEKILVQEYNPEIRVEQITKAFELVLSLLSMQFGYGSKTSFWGRITYRRNKQKNMFSTKKSRLTIWRIKGGLKGHYRKNRLIILQINT